MNLANARAGSDPVMESIFGGKGMSVSGVSFRLLKVLTWVWCVFENGNYNVYVI